MEFYSAWFAVGVVEGLLHIGNVDYNDFSEYYVHMQFEPKCLPSYLSRVCVI